MCRRNVQRERFLTRPYHEQVDVEFGFRGGR
jgi:hypothetical protein